MDVMGEIREREERHPRALLICRDDDLRDALKETLECLGCQICALASTSGPLVPMAPSGAFQLALLCLDCCSPDAVAEAASWMVSWMASSPALRGATALLGTTLPEDLLPEPPESGRARDISYLCMPFELDALERILEGVTERSPRSLATVTA